MMMIIIIIIIIMALVPLVGAWPLYQFLDPIHSREDSLDGGSAHCKAATYIQNNTNRINAQTSMPGVRFEPTIPAFEREKTVHALDDAATVIGAYAIKLAKIITGNSYVNTVARRIWGGDKRRLWRGA
jgi:hypothetical protein